MSSTVLTEHRNSENELITIEVLHDGNFAGQQVLCLRDDWPSQAIAPHLLDDSTKKWLYQWLKKEMRDDT